jgi:hypothetical protein
MYLRRNHPKLDLPVALADLLVAASVTMAQQAGQAFRLELQRRTVRRKGGNTLRPGPQTPLWNELRRQLRPHLLRYGHQANLARLLGLPRQRVNAFVTGGGEMPDAERTLQLLAWLMSVQCGKRPG